MRSAEHQAWDAFMVTGPLRAGVFDFAAACRRMTAALQSVGEVHRHQTETLARAAAVMHERLEHPLMILSTTTAGHDLPRDASRARPDCPSCGGTGWAAIRLGTVTVAGGTCECIGGGVRAAEGGDR
jgi:hypothetical protein